MVSLSDVGGIELTKRVELYTLQYFPPPISSNPFVGMGWKETFVFHESVSLCHLNRNSVGNNFVMLNFIFPSYQLIQNFLFLVYQL